MRAMHSREGSYYPLLTCKRRAVIEDNESDRESDDITPGDLQRDRFVRYD